MRAGRQRVGRLAMAAFGAGLTVSLVPAVGLPEAAGRAVPMLGQSAATGCTTQFASAPRLSPRTAFVSLAGPPFGIAVTPDSRWSFVAE